MLEEIIQGLTSNPKTVSSKYLYDQRGAELFDQICELKEYYPTRTEISILEANIDEIVSAFGKHPILYEFGSGSSTKTEILLNHMNDIIGYIPIDICPDYLSSAALKLQKKFPKLNIFPTCRDFTEKLDFTYNEVESSVYAPNRVGFFPGSTIGNFTPMEAKNFLANAAASLGPQGKFFIGVDADKEIETLERAYNDSLGITGEFNLNILRRINREFNADFNLDYFQHRAVYNQKLNRIEMHLICLKNCTVTIQNQEITFQKDESIHTESSYKYPPTDFISLAAKAGLRFLKRWSDERDYFNLFLFEIPPISAAQKLRTVA